MPAKLKDPVLSLAVANLTKVDTSDAENLHSIWAVFTKCASALENGRRLENLSWRLWNSGESAHARAALRAAAAKPLEDVPELSASVDSAASEGEKPRRKTDRFQQVLESFKPMPQEQLYWRQLHEAHLAGTPESSVLEPATESVPALSPALSTEPSVSPVSATADAPDLGSVSPPADEAVEGSDYDSMDEDLYGSGSGLPRAHSVVRGFSPTAISIHSVRSDLSMNGRASEANKKKMFFIESSPSESDGFGESVSPTVPGALSGAAKGRRSGAATGVPSSLRTSNSSTSVQSARKHASFVEPSTRRAKAPVLLEDDEDDEDDDDDDDYDDVSESAIEDDDDSGWDSVDDSAPPSFDERSLFMREERPAIQSRRSLLSTLLHSQTDMASLVAGSRSTPALAADRAPHILRRPSDEDAAERLRMKRTPSSVAVSQASKGAPAPAALSTAAVGANGADYASSIQSTSSAASTVASGVEPMQVAPPVVRADPTGGAMIPVQQRIALSPRSTRRNMLATELSESLRRNLLTERRLKNQTAASLKRRHTTNNMANLAAYPEPDAMASWKNDADSSEFGYHARGW
ncbi:uncharacterized protein V1510DRAFT_391491 [Dipodascopsis tothii]|uniref:uncharacterized protein n=1 Tax=Dipodascopsis tothii TaxID=44089 RepID=UPI0034CE3AA2